MQTTLADIIRLIPFKQANIQCFGYSVAREGSITFTADQQLTLVKHGRSKTHLPLMLKNVVVFFLNILNTSNLWTNDKTDIDSIK